MHTITSMANNWVEKILSDLASLPLSELVRVVVRREPRRLAKSAEERSAIARKAVVTRRRKAAARKAVATRQKRKELAAAAG